MKLRKLGHAMLALVGSIGISFGLTSCSLDHTVGYVYVLGNQLNGQINAFREDNNDGELKNVQGSPSGSGGANPIRAIVPSGNKFLYVLNAGTPATDASGNITYSSANITLFSIGGYGNLSQQIQYSSQGAGSTRLAVDATGAHLFVLDQYAPVGLATGATTSPTTQTSRSAAYPCQSADGLWHPTGDITVFNIDPATGRLTLVTNATQQTLTYFPVGCFPVDFTLAGSFLYTMDAGAASNGDLQTVNTYAVAATTAQLTPTQTGVQPISAANNTNIVTINSNAGKYVYLLNNDPAGSTTPDPANDKIYIYTVGTNGALTAVTGSPYNNAVNTQAGEPIQSLVDSTGKFFYVANAGPASGTSNGNADVGGYIINATTGYFDSPTQTSPFVLGTASKPVCIFEDPTEQYLYVAGAADSSITGRRIDPNTGVLSALREAGTFPTVGTPSWCVGISSAL